MKLYVCLKEKRKNENDNRESYIERFDLILC